MKLGVFGGSFDPIHRGHLEPVRQARAALGLDRVVFLPTARPPHKEDRDLAPAHARFVMVELALLDEEGLRASPWELTPDRPTYTVETLERFREHHPEATLFLLLGSDSLVQLPTWRRWRDLLELARLVVLTRPGFRLEDLADRLAPEVHELLPGPGAGTEDRRLVLVHCVEEASATEIRRRLARGEEPPAGWLHPRVLHYIHKYDLYR